MSYRIPWSVVFVLASLPAVLPAASPKSTLDQSYSKLPLAFEPNAGQAPPGVRYLARKGSTLFSLTDDGVTIQQGESSVKLRFQRGAARSVEGLQRLRAVSHYYIGSDPSGWRTNIPNFASVRYGQVWRGIDVLFYGDDQGLEYDVLLSPGADLKQVAFEAQGATNLRVDSEGNLHITSPTGELLQHRLRVFQERGGTRTQLPAEYYLLGGNRFGFTVPGYDPALPLTIDPVLSYSAGLALVDRAIGAAVDANGNGYVTGGIVASGQNRNVFVTKFDLIGNTALFNVFFGGVNDDVGSALAVDSAGNVFVSGGTFSPDFPVSSPFQASLNTTGACTVCNSDAFLVKFMPSGLIIFSSFYGGTGNDYATDLAMDKAGNVYLGGVAGVGSKFPVTAGALKTNNGNIVAQDDGFILKIAGSGAAPIYSTLLGGSDSDKIWSIAVDGAGSVYATGVTFSFDFLGTAGLSSTHSAFLVKVNAAGSSLRYGTLYGTGATVGAGVGVDEFGRAYISVNQITGGAFPRETIPGSIPNVQSQASVVKFNSLGSEVLGQFALIGAQYGLGVAVNAAGNAFFTGSTGAGSFSSTGDAFTANTTPAQSFLAVLNPFATNTVFSTILGSLAPPPGATDTFLASGIRIALDSASSAHIAGVFNYNGTLAGRNYLVKVGGFNLPACLDSTVTASATTFNSGGGIGSISLGTPCAWTAIPGTKAVGIADPASGTGNAAITFDVGFHSGEFPRTLSIATAGKIVPLIEKGISTVPPYDDVPASNVFADYVSLLKFNSITTGCTTTSYCPDATVTRGQMAVFLIRSMLGGDNFPFAQTPFFDDVPLTHPFFKWIQKMREFGITSGCTATTYCPDLGVTRSQVAAFLIRGRFGNSFSFSPFPYFIDVPGANPFFPYVQKMKELGISNGCSTFTFCPDDPNTRAQMATFIIRGYFTPW